MINKETDRHRTHFEAISNIKDNLRSVLELAYIPLLFYVKPDTGLRKNDVFQAKYDLEESKIVIGFRQI